MNDTPSKQQITEKIKAVTNILVTVSTNPSVDELSAALGLTLMLNKLDKHATAVFSGTIPPAITFLDPSKTFENTVDSLRDFIIALDKEKADRLRYRVEDDVVRIFITPYRTHITEEDLEFTHGDFNVELVLALGVENKEVLDKAIAAHGRILHDATVATINAQNKTSDLGSISWQDNSASSLCEMLVSISEALQPNVLDEQIASALLTGIVAATDRFSNHQTSPKSMTMAAQLMAAGANQQLIAAKLEENAAISPEDEAEDNPDSDGNTPLKEGSSKKLRSKQPDKPKEKPAKKDKNLGEMKIEHGDKEQDDTHQPAPTGTIEEHDKRNKQNAGEQALDEALSKLNATTQTTETLLPKLETELKKYSTGHDDNADNSQNKKPDDSSWRSKALPLSEPSMGGALNATTKDVSESRREEESQRNLVTLEHSDDSAATVKGRTIMPPSSHNDKPVNEPTPSAAKTLADIETTLKQDLATTPNSTEHTPETAREEVDKALSSESPPAAPALPVNPTTTVSSLPPLPDFSSLPPLPPINNQSTPPNLDANGLPPFSPAASSVSTPPPSSSNPRPSNEPGQFQIPSQ